LFALYLLYLGRIRSDLILSFTIKPNIYASLAARLLKIPIVNNVSGLGTAFIKEGPVTEITKFLYRLAFKGSSTVFFQNDEDREQFIGARIVTRAQASLLPGSGVDLERFSPAPLPTEKPFRFLLIARLVWDKGIREYVEAARLVRQQFPDVQFQILGPVDVDNRTAVPRATLNTWVAEGTIEHLGAAADVRPYLGRADCVVLPSYREGLPRSLLEASAMARPIIGTDVPGVRDVVQDGVTGLLCEVRSAQSLAAAMLSMLALSHDERSQMGWSGRRKVEQEFDVSIVTRSYMEAAERML
jgi:glycosyltransferase involved in cell wall biosynthesis